MLECYSNLLLRNCHDQACFAHGKALNNNHIFAHGKDVKIIYFYDY